MGRILGVLCLSGLRFFLGDLFFCEEHLYILLSFHQFLYLIPCLAVLRVRRFLFCQQLSVFDIQFLYLRQFFQPRFIESNFCCLVQCDLLPVLFQKLLAVSGFAVSIIHRPVLA